MKSGLILFLILISCGSNSSHSKRIEDEKYATPANAVLTFVGAMDQRDSVAAMSSLAASARDTIMKNVRGNGFKFIFDVFNGIHRSVKILRVDSISVDTAKVFVIETLSMDTTQVKRDSCFYDVLREKGEWKVGELVARKNSHS